MSNLSAKGKVTAILPLESGVSSSGKEWQKQEFAIETDDQYPKLIVFTLFGDKIKTLDHFKVSDEVEVHFNLESREYNSKYFHNINAWKVDKLVDGEQIEPNNDENGQNNVPNDVDYNDSDNLPF